MKVAIIGAGLIGNKRAYALDENDSLIIVCDKDNKKAQKLAERYKTNHTDDNKNVSITVNFTLLFKISIAFLRKRP